MCVWGGVLSLRAGTVIMRDDYVLDGNGERMGVG